MSNPNPSPATRYVKGAPSPNPGGRPKTRPYSEAARQLLEANGDMPQGWDAKALTNAQKAVIADFEAWIKERDGAARAQFLDRAEGKAVPAQETLDAVQASGAGRGRLLEVLGVRLLEASNDDPEP